MAAGASYSYAPWKDTPGSNDLNISGDNRKKRNINIGLVGDAQSGKSSFVNAIFGYVNTGILIILLTLFCFLFNYGACSLSVSLICIARLEISIHS